MSHLLTPSQSQNFAYDDADRLTSWNEGGAATTQSWTLSPVGDWTSTVRNGVVENRTHTKVHEVTNAVSFSPKDAVTSLLQSA